MTLVHEATDEFTVEYVEGVIGPTAYDGGDVLSEVLLVGADIVPTGFLICSFVDEYPAGDMNACDAIRWRDHRHTGVTSSS